MKGGSLMRFKVAFKVVEINKAFKVDLLQSKVVWPPFFEVRPPIDDTFYEGSGTEPISDLSKQYKNKSSRNWKRTILYTSFLVELSLKSEKTGVSLMVVKLMSN